MVFTLDLDEIVQSFNVDSLIRLYKITGPGEYVNIVKRFDNKYEDRHRFENKQITYNLHKAEVLKRYVGMIDYKFNK